LYPASHFFVATNQRFSCSMDWSQGTLTRNCGFYLENPKKIFCACLQKFPFNHWRGHFSSWWIQT
jgi:hypothetical protein